MIYSYANQIYFPDDIIKPLRKSLTNHGNVYLLGFKLEHIFIVIQFTPSKNLTEFNSEALNGLSTIGTVGSSSRSTKEPKRKIANESKWLELHFEDSFEYPIVRDKKNDSKKYTFVLYHPPNFKNLEYLSINPILLQSTGRNEMDENDVLNDNYVTSKFEKLATPTITPNAHPFNNEILDKINQCYRHRAAFEKWSSKVKLNRKDSGENLSKLAWSFSRRFILAPVALFVKCIQFLSIVIIKVLNYKFFQKITKNSVSGGHQITQYSAVFRQLELRLKQINYFPIQILCYYDRTILYNENENESKNYKAQDQNQNEFSLALNLPIFNSNLNINNSNYINFYNSLWLILNDILIGLAVQKYILDNYQTIARFINEIAIKKILFEYLHNLISWVSYRHPAGFKLNNELGSFIGDLFLWTLRFWRLLCLDIFTISEKESVDGGWYIGGGGVGDFLEEVGGFPFHGVRILNAPGPLTTPLFRLIVSIICSIGFSFFIGFLIDYLQIISFHIFCFYYTSAKIYKRQIETLKSLFQLFCGKKYNILRNRIDNLDNYSTSANGYEVDQLLLGTLFFVVLILLLPTIFAFYLMFFLTRLACLILINVAENFLVVVNFFPIFVILLKMKNSKRLQGGLSFTFKTTNPEGNITYLQLSNKSLSYKEIFDNFVKLFKNSRTFTIGSVLPKLINGEPISLIQKTDLKFSYLMLPRNFDQTIRVWDHFSKNGNEVQRK